MNSEQGAVVIHCSDPRYQGAFHSFIRDQLGLKQYALVAVPGGPQFLSAVELLPKFAWAGWRWMKFLGKLGATGRVILIAHEDCRWYHETGVAASSPSLREKQDSDLRAVCAGLKERFGAIAIEQYYARFEGSRIVFDKL